jgi:HEAT repeat protein
VEVRRATAVFLLTQFDPNNSQQVDAFVGLLDDNDRMVRARGLDAVVQFTLADKVATLPTLIPLLDPRREDRPENRSAAIRLCAGLKAAAIEASSALSTAASGDPDPKVRSAALAALAQVAEPATSVPVLSTAITDQDAAVRLVAAARLRQLGPAASPAAKALAAALADSSTDVAEAAGEALLRIGPPAVEPLAEQLASSNPAARKLAIVCLAKLGPVAKSAATAIAKSRQDSDPQIRELAEATLKRLEGK